MEQNIGKVQLVEVPIEKTFLFKDQIVINKNSKTLREGLSYRFTQDFLSPKNKLLIVCPPTYNLEEQQQTNTEEENNKLFDGKGYIKAIPNEYIQSLIGQQSGIRSAIVDWNGKKYRLKGCGNENKGFILRNLGNNCEIRGCCFEHTVKRELFMSKKIETILEKYNIQVGNKGVGYWQYGDIESINQNLKEKLQNSIPIVPKYCGIYETLGDSRLGTHLLQGLRCILNENVKDWTVDNIKQLITVKSRIVENRKSFNGNSWDLNNTQYCERIMTSDFQFQEDDYVQNRIFDWVNEKNNISITENLNDYVLLQNLSILHQRLGYEIGRVKRIFIDYNISWGYFRDHFKYQYHSNAHFDNFLVILGKPNLLAPLDFDLAYFKEEYLNIDYEDEQQENNNQKYGKFDLQQWLLHLDLERIGLELAIAGMDIVEASNMFVNKQSTDVEEFFEILLRDQMRIGYLQGFQLEEDSSLYQIRYEKIQEIIQQALQITTHIIA